MSDQILSGDYVSTYHRPVLWREVDKFLVINKNGIYIDGTLGGGGHSHLILDKLDKKGKVVALDRDADAISFATDRLSNYAAFTAVKANFSELDRVLAELKIVTVDGILLDLGLSSYQIDEDIRGFAFSVDGPLDMRMDRDEAISAKNIINETPEQELADILYRFGEERKSRQIAARICRERMKTPFTRTSQLKGLVQNFYHGPRAVKAFARIFQAIRIYVNAELEHLEKALEKAFSVLGIGGRLAVISYHSLEDRIVKRQYRYWEKECICDPEIPVCRCDKECEVKIIKPFPFKAAADEIENNSRSRSARMRICEKVVLKNG